MLSIVATPIGNLKDITLRALETLKAADLIAAEDTRHTKILLKAHGIETPLMSFHDHSSEAKLNELIRRLKEGMHLALVSDAGTPLIADPGFPLVRAAIKENIKIEVLPGPSAAIAALSASGLPAESFSFFGFLPQKGAARLKKLGELVNREETLIFYESPFRVAKTLAAMHEVFGAREAVVGRELTKKFEEFKRGRLDELAKLFKDKNVKGEMVILVSGLNRKACFS